MAESATVSVVAGCCVPCHALTWVWADITGGTGKYEGASGVMVDTFIGPAGASSFPIHGVGFFWLPSSKQ